MYWFLLTFVCFCICILYIQLDEHNCILGALKNKLYYTPGGSFVNIDDVDAACTSRHVVVEGINVDDQ